MLLFIINPAASSGNGKKVWKQLEKYLRANKAAYRCHFLRHPKEAGKIAEMLSVRGKPCQVFIVGGDGTVNEFLQGVGPHTGISLGVIPTGSGNDFAHALSDSKDPVECLRHMLENVPGEPMDIGLVSSPHSAGKASFGVSSGFGFDAAACYEASKGRMKAFFNNIRLGKLVYLFSAISILFRSRPFNMHGVLDDEEELDFERTWFAAAMNTKFEGGGFMFCPAADPGDGYLDLIVAEGISRFRILMTIPFAFSGHHTDKKGIHIYRCKKACFTADRPQCIHTDGEHFGFYDQVTWNLRRNDLRAVRS